VRCPGCTGIDDRVIDSRLADDGAAIRRRRECLQCGRRFTTYERLDELPLTVVKRSGQRQPFDRSKVVAGVRAATKNRPFTAEQMESVAAEVEERMRLDGPEVTTEQVGRSVLEQLRDLDEVAYVRFASVYKGFSDVGDFQREVGLLTKSTEPKQPSGPSRPAESSQPNRSSQPNGSSQPT
jgi:transcriptional repressor NrdR